MNTDILNQLYRQVTGADPEQTTLMPASGSNRRYFRLTGVQSLVGVIGEDKRENEAFLYMADHFRRKGLPVPEVHAVSDDKMAYVQEDLGDGILFNLIEKGRKTRVFGSVEKNMLKRTLEQLCRFQFEGADGFDFSKCYPTPEFDRRSILWDLNYFKYCFLKSTGLEFDESRLEDDFEHLADVLLRSLSATFMYRDFQSRNVMMRDGEPWFIDFQGGRKGPIYYDVASFLWQAKANFPDSLRRELISHYVKSLRKYKPVDDTYFRNQLRHFVLFRTLQVLGAYGFRGYFEKKPYFMQSVPFAINNLRGLLKEPYVEYPYLNDLLKRLVGMSQFTDEMQRHMLTVRVMSFAYKKGIPNDISGNGGGYVFDLRAVNNPGKYDKYKSMTGLDKPVVQFLESESDIKTYLEHVYALVDATVKRYMERGFTNLMVCFGCTGGQHRSVYCAQHTAEHLNEKFNVKVELIHREQDLEQTLNHVD